MVFHLYVMCILNVGDFLSAGHNTLYFKGWKIHHGFSIQSVFSFHLALGV